jgi:hypothetical protein
LVNARKTLRFHGARVLRATRGAWWDLKRPALERPIFVVGCSRAGTTVVYKTFSESRELGTLQRETHDFWAMLHPRAERNWGTHALTALDASEGDRNVVSRYFTVNTGRPRIVDKNNQNGLCVPYLFALFPDAHFVYVKRSPGDNIHSLIEGWGKAEEFATWSHELPSPIAVEGGRYKRWCFFLAEGWRDYVNASIEDVCAFQYLSMNRAIIDAGKAIPPAQWTEIVYEDLLQDPVQGFRRAFEACDLPIYGGPRAALQRRAGDAIQRFFRRSVLTSGAISPIVSESAGFCHALSVATEWDTGFQYRKLSDHS